MATDNDPSPKHGSNGGAVEKRLTVVEGRLGVIEKTMVTSERLEREVGVLRAELREGFGAVRAELHEQIGHVRAELHAGLGGLRAEMHDQLGGLRAVMHERDGRLRAEIAKIPFDTVKWLAALAGIAAAIATAVYNIWLR